MGMKTIYDVLEAIRGNNWSERDKGERFEKLMQRWLRVDGFYGRMYSEVYLWGEFAERHGLEKKDLGIDLVAVKGEGGGLVAIQCKFYAEGTVVDKAAVDTFLSTASAVMRNEAGEEFAFEEKVFVMTNDRLGVNARTTLENHNARIITIGALAESGVDWGEIAEGRAQREREVARARDYQEVIVGKARAHFRDHERGTLVMACGTGKTLTSLFIAQDMLAEGGVVLFLAPSIALVSQTLKSWYSRSAMEMDVACVCSDREAARGTYDLVIDGEDRVEESLLELPIASCTNPERAAEILRRPTTGHKGRLTVIFATYQSIEVVHEAQRRADVVFDLVICDEAHRTASTVLNAKHVTRIGKDVKEKKGEEEKGGEVSSFVRVHDGEYIRAGHRLYMTATPKVYRKKEKERAEAVEDTLYSMDDENIFGERFYTLTFGEAVERKLLTDYKVLVLTIDSRQVSGKLLDELKEAREKRKAKEAEEAAKAEKRRAKGEAKDGGEENGEVGEDGEKGEKVKAADVVVPEMTARLIGALAAMSKMVDDSMPGAAETFADDPHPELPLRSAIAFCDYVNVPKKGKPGAYVIGTTRSEFEAIAEQCQKERERGERGEAMDEYLGRLARVRSTCVSGEMSTNERERNLEIIRNPEAGCANIVCNVNCLSEGVDVPSLDAVIFLAPKSSPITLVQSVGRVMRRAEGKEYGYVIIPVICDMEGDVGAALKRTEFERVWDILCAMRSHDERLSAELSSHTYQHVRVVQYKSPEQRKREREERERWKREREQQQEQEKDRLRRELELREDKEKSKAEQIYAAVVERCGDRMYWPRWSAKAGEVARRFVGRIEELLGAGMYREEMSAFVGELRRCMNGTVGEHEAVEFLAQHLVTQPVFDALFADYHFAQNNAVSRAMGEMIGKLEGHAFVDDRELLEDFEMNVSMVAKGLDTSAKRQEMIKTLYENFFAAAFPKVSAQLGIVYTPVECVDFIVRSVDYLLGRDYGTRLARRGVRVLDPFAGTGTFTTRALAYLDEEGIGDEELRAKYREDIRCNEIVPLSYYVADVNIETEYNGLERWKGGGHEYEAYDGISLADTFALAEEHEERRGTLEFIDRTLARNTDAALEMLRHPINVIWGNPPYSVGQRSANDNAQNVHYPHLEERIAQTYARESDSTSKKALYDSYIKAFRWATDRLREHPEEGGIVAYISNGAWIDGNSQAGMRATFVREFDRIYVLNLRGNQRTSGELSRREGGKIFGSGSRTPIAITILERFEQGRHGRGACEIWYRDIGDYMTREEKLGKLVEYGSVEGVEWMRIEPNAKHDWINQRDGTFDAMIALAPEKKYDLGSESWFVVHSRGLATARDAFAYNFSRDALISNINSSIDFYNSEVDRYLAAKASNANIRANNFITYSASKFSWGRQQIIDLTKGKKYQFAEDSVRTALYRPFVETYGYFNRQLNDMVYQLPNLFPTPSTPNLVICVSGVGVTKDFSCIITDKIPDLELIGKSQCFPLYYYVQAAGSGLFGGESGLERRDGVSDYAVRVLGERGIRAEKEEIFYAIYGALHERGWRERYGDDLRKSLPRLDLARTREEFERLRDRGRRMAELHLAGRLTGEMVGVIRGSGMRWHGFAVEDDGRVVMESEVRVVRMVLERRGRSRLDIAEGVYIEGIPAGATGYVVNGKSPLEWVVERMRDGVDEKTGIRSDVNAYGGAEYVVDAVLRSIVVGMEMVGMM